MSESALNDAMGAIVTFVMIGLVMGGTLSIGGSFLNFVREAGLGIIVGAVIGGLGLYLTAHEKYRFLGEYASIVTIIVVAGGYVLSNLIGASGYMAAFIAGLLFGNSKLFGFDVESAEEERLDNFIGDTSLIMRMFIFILLGSQVNFQLLSEFWVGGIITVVIFMFIARPIVVFLFCLPDRRAKWEIKELLFISWVRETGVIPAALAGMLIGLGAPKADLIASVTFIVILVTILVQATTRKWWGGKLGLLVEEPIQTPKEAEHSKEL
jgi:cell volume regulation protein A